MDFAEALLRFKNMAIYYKNDKKTKEVSYLYKIYGDNPIMSFAMLELLIPEELKNDRNTKFRLFTEALIQPIDRTLEKEKKENLINEYMQDLNFKKGPSK